MAYVKIFESHILLSQFCLLFHNNLQILLFLPFNVTREEFEKKTKEYEEKEEKYNLKFWLQVNCEVNSQVTLFHNKFHSNFIKNK